MTNQEYLVLDVETFSEADLEEVGGPEYSCHPSTEILCLAFRHGTKANLLKKQTKVWFPHHDALSWRSAFPDLLSCLRDPNILLVAHNAFFEQNIIKNVFGPKYMRSIPELRTIPIERWTCTASMARAKGFPGKLEQICKILSLAHQKNMDGHRLMLKLSQPRKPSKKNPKTRWDDEEEYRSLGNYCIGDVDATVDLFLTLPELCPYERKVWVVNQKINHRGFAVDRDYVTKVIPLITHETKRLDRRVLQISKGKLNSVRQVAALKKVLLDQNVKLPNLQAKTIQEILLTDKLEGKPVARELLEIREVLGRSSVTKYKAFDYRTRFDGRARDTTIYHGAHTGRDTGVGLQPHNLFKTVIPQGDVVTGIELVRNGDIDTLDALYDKPMELFASALRSSIIAAPDCTLDVGDWATIEVRVLFWLAKHAKGLKAFKDGADLYIEMAAYLYSLDAKKLAADYKAGSDLARKRRQLGKQVILGAGFGIGVNGKKFQMTCASYGIPITIELAQKAVRAYRELHPAIPAFWTSLEKAITLAIQNPGKRYRLGFLVWELEGKFLHCTLPSGRKLSYYKPRITKKQTPWGMRNEISYWGIHPKTKQWCELSSWGGKFTENVVQAIARDVMVEGLIRLEDEGRSLPILSVHDEIVCERNLLKAPTEYGLDSFTDTISIVPKWAEGLPIKVEAWSEPRYRK